MDGQKINMGYTILNHFRVLLNIIQKIKYTQKQSPSIHIKLYNIKGNKMEKNTQKYTLPRKKIRRLKQAITRKLLGKTVIEQVHISSSMLTTYI